MTSFEVFIMKLIVLQKKELAVNVTLEEEDLTDSSSTDWQDTGDRRYPPVELTTLLLLLTLTSETR